MASSRPHLGSTRYHMILLFLLEFRYVTGSEAFAAGSLVWACRLRSIEIVMSALSAPGNTNCCPSHPYSRPTSWPCTCVPDLRVAWYVAVNSDIVEVNFNRASAVEGLCSPDTAPTPWSRMLLGSERLFSSVLGTWNLGRQWCPRLGNFRYIWSSCCA